MGIPLYQVDAFAERLFEGNPAAVCPLDAWIDDASMQAIAHENQLSETAFLVRRGELYELRWFTPVAEVDLCGHATLAAAHVLFRHRGESGDVLRFATRSGELTARRHGARIQIDLPAELPQPIPAPDWLAAGLGVVPLEVLAATDLIAVVPGPGDVRALRPDFGVLKQAEARGVLVTAAAEPAAWAGEETARNDLVPGFVSRCFFPALGIDEDPVTGSAHSQLAPYWSERTGFARLHARQLSERGGALSCEVVNGRVLLVGGAVDYLLGEIQMPGHS